MIETIIRLASNWWQWMAPMFLQVLLLIAIVTAIDMLIRKWAWPQVRYALWLLIFIKLIIPPSWSMSSGIVPKIEPLEKQLHMLDVGKPVIQSSLATLPVKREPHVKETAAGKVCPVGESNLAFAFLGLRWVARLVLLQPCFLA